MGLTFTISWYGSGEIPPLRKFCSHFGSNNNNRICSENAVHRSDKKSPEALLISTFWIETTFHITQQLYGYASKRTHSKNNKMPLMKNWGNATISFHSLTLLAPLAVCVMSLYFLFCHNEETRSICCSAWKFLELPVKRTESGSYVNDRCRFFFYSVKVIEIHNIQWLLICKEA